MKTTIIFFCIFALFVIGLLSSNWYDHKVNQRQIANYQCKNTIFKPFPTEFNQAFEVTRKPAHNRLLGGSKLVLKDLELSTLPEQLFYKYPCISELDLQNNQFTEIPLTIRYLTDLERLDVSNNQLTSLSPLKKMEGNFYRLEVFFSNKNKLDTLDFFPGSDYLKVLYYSSNNIQYIDTDAIPSRYEVEEFSLRNNKLTSIPAELLNRLEVQKLYLDDNQISNIEGDLEYNYIGLLSLNNNAFERFPTELGFLEIVELQMEENPIKGKVVINGFNNLKELKLNSGEITSVEIKNSSITRASELDFSNNKINNLQNFARDSDGSDGTNLNVLRLNNNEFKTFPRDVLYFKQLNKINLADNKIRNIIFDELATRSNISILDLFDNELQTVEGLNSLKNLQVLYLGGNNLTKVPEGILNSSTLTKVDMRENAIRGKIEVSAPIMNELKLNGNRIISFHLKGATSLKTLDLSNNDLRTLNFEKGSLYEMEELNISDNPNLKTFPEEILFEYSNLKTIYAVNIGIDEKDMLFLQKRGAFRGISVIIKSEDINAIDGMGAPMININVRN